MTSENKKKIAQEISDNLRNSWTYKKLTPQERKTWEELTEWAKNCGTVEHMNTTQQINYLLIGIYHAFLQGIGYTDSKWRE